MGGEGNVCEVQFWSPCSAWGFRRGGFRVTPGSGLDPPVGSHGAVLELGQALGLGAGPGPLSWRRNLGLGLGTLVLETDGGGGGE